VSASPFAFVGKVGMGVLVGVLWVTAPATTSSASTVVDGRFARAAMQTSPGLPVQSSDGRSAASSLAEVRRLAGLTWEQIARLFGVTRRAVHSWASGGAMSAANDERLHRTLAVMRRIDRGSSDVNRTLLFSSPGGGMTAFDMLVQGDFESVAEYLGDSAMSRPVRSEASTSRRTYQSMSPVALLSAVQDIGPVKRGERRVAKTTRVKRDS
jgi:hypothetical protein